MKKDDDGAAARSAYVDEALEKCRRLCRRAGVVPVAMLAARPLRTNDPAGGWRLEVLSLEGGVVDPAQLFRKLGEELPEIIAELEGGGSARGGE